MEMRQLGKLAFPCIWEITYSPRQGPNLTNTESKILPKCVRAVPI